MNWKVDDALLILQQGKNKEAKALILCLGQKLEILRDIVGPRGT